MIASVSAVIAYTASEAYHSCVFSIYTNEFYRKHHWPQIKRNRNSCESSQVIDHWASDLMFPYKVKLDLLK